MRSESKFMIAGGNHTIIARVPPKGAGEVAVHITILLIPCGESVLRYHLFHRKRSPFPKGEGTGAPAPDSFA